MTKFIRVNFLICFALLLQSCMNQPARRRGYGYKAPKRSDVFTPVKKKVAVLEIFNESPYGKEDLAITATEELKRELSRSEEYVIDSSASQQFATSKQIYSEAGNNMTQLIQKAKVQGINLIIFGRITHARVRQKTDEIGIVRKTKSYAESQIEIKVLDVHSNKEIFSEKMSGNTSDSSHKFFMNEEEDNLTYRRNILRYSIKVATRRFIPNLNKLGTKLDWTGRVAKIIGTKIYINAGRVSGINVGDILKVLTPGQEIYDPQSGSFLGVSKGEVKGTIEVIDYFGQDGALAILHSGGQVTEGDFIQLY